MAVLPALRVRVSPRGSALVLLIRSAGVAGFAKSGTSVPVLTWLPPL
jgi:hypothetical protein